MIREPVRAFRRLYQDIGSAALVRQGLKNRAVLDVCDKILQVQQAIEGYHKYQHLTDGGPTGAFDLSTDAAGPPFGAALVRLFRFIWF
jgi:hypothetical protein